jgi:S1-C subfamily serine protease
MKNPQRLMLFTVLASLVVGACAGVVASVLTSNALEDYATALLGDRGFTALEPRKPNANPLDYAEALQRVRDTQSRSLAVITKTVADSSSPNQWIGPADAVGVGMVVSANGWVLTTSDEISAQNTLAGHEVWVRGVRYGLEEMVSDDLSPFVLLRLKDANGLTPVGFGASEDSRNGDMVFLLPDALGLLPTTIENSEMVILDGPQPAEVYATAWSLALEEETGPVLSGTGDLLAFVAATGETVPLHHGVAFVQETLRSGGATHAALGAYVIDLFDVYNLDSDIRQGLSSGALVMAPSGRLAVPTQGPAGESGLLAQDIITAVDGEAITPNTSLAEVLSTYDPGQTARLSVLRAGAPIEVSVVLGDASALVY